MADPRNELADIIAPVAPEIASAGGDVPPWVAVLALTLLVGGGVAAWLWRRNRLARELRRLAADVARRGAEVPELAGRLDAWARARFRLARLAPHTPPQGVDAAAWSAWADALAGLRFAPPRADGYAALAALCQTAQSWGRRG